MQGVETFEFDNQASNIGALTRQMLGRMEVLLDGHPRTRAVMLRSKFIIAELLNNAVKHSGTELTQFIIKVEPSCVSISKRDKGRPFNLIEHVQAPQDQIVVSADAMHLLYAVVKEDTVHFFCKENFTLKVDATELSEHMGLLIITKAADEFIYRFEHPENIFCAQLDLS